MVSAAKGAEQFYTIEHHASRSEGLELARERDTAAASVSGNQGFVRITKIVPMIFLRGFVRFT